MGLAKLFLMGYSLVLGTYEVAKTNKKLNSKNLLRDVTRYEKLKKNNSFASNDCREQ